MPLLPTKSTELQNTLVAYFNAAYGMNLNGPAAGYPQILSQVQASSNPLQCSDYVQERIIVNDFNNLNLGVKAAKKRVELLWNRPKSKKYSPIAWFMKICYHADNDAELVPNDQVAIPMP